MNVVMLLFLLKGGDTVALSENAYNNKKRYNLEYAKTNLKRIPLDVQLSKYEEIKTAAAAVDETINGYIKKAIDQRIESGS